ncbi:MAG: hypothetical protein KAJ52_08570 [Sedimentisphaerales bacterium]|nr:hypothetical protein [Sedimentisphaerales bacterium]
MDIENDHSSAWGVPRPAFRLWLSCALGFLGILLLPAQEDFAPHAFAGVQRAPLLAWMTAALASVLLLHRVEKTKVSVGICATMGLALVLCLMLPEGVGRKQHPEAQGLAGFVWFCFIILMLVVGASIVRLRFRRETKPMLWVESLLRGPAIALVAPLLLFASRPVARGESSSRMEALSRAAFVLFPIALAGGFALSFALAVFGYHEIASGLGLVCISFSVWAWLGCALLFIMSPWPKYPRIPRTDHLTKARKIGSLATIAFVAMALVQLVLLGEGWLFLILFHPLFIWGGVGCMLIILLSPWPEYPPVPRLGEIPEACKIGPWGTALFLTIALVALGSFAISPFLSVVSGRLFASHFSRAHIGGALDQPSLHKWYFLFVYFSAQVLPYVAIARWMSNRRTRLGYWTFAIPTVGLCLCLLSILTLPFYWCIQYIGAMGYTCVRVHGVAYGLAGYIVILVFLFWAVWVPNKKREFLQGVVEN